jgi:hypothetical protein
MRFSQVPIGDTFSFPSHPDWHYIKTAHDEYQTENKSLTFGMTGDDPYVIYRNWWNNLHGLARTFWNHLTPSKRK